MAYKTQQRAANLRKSPARVNSMADVYLANRCRITYDYNVKNRHYSNMHIIQDYIKKIRAGGKDFFTANGAISELNISRNAFNCAMYRMKKKGDIISPAKNLYVIVPPEHHVISCLPAEELIPILMKYWGIDYYVCLLSAALYHGASHQKPQVFQVMVAKQLKPLECGKIKISFLYKKSLKDCPLRQITVRTGYLNISSPELTVTDLLLYSHKAGGLSHVATVLNELVENVYPNKLLALLQNSKENSWIQRLGYILEHIDTIEVKKCNKITSCLQRYLKKQKLSFIPLAPGLPIKGAAKNNKWMIIENTTIESDDI